MAEVGKISEDEAGAALHQVMNIGGEGSGIPQKTEEVEEPSAGEATASEVQAEPEAQEVVEVQEDDLDSLKKRNVDLEAQITQSDERYKERLLAQNQRNASNEGILRDRFLRKSTASAKALEILRATRTADGVSEADVDRAILEIENTMNPQSASYVAPQTAPSGAANEDQALVVNSFLNEHNMTVPESDEFGRWMQVEAATAMSPQEQAVAQQSLDGYLRLAHGRWQQGIREKEKQATRSDAVGAVKSVQRTQREAARAASASVTSPKKQTVGSPAGADAAELTPDDISTLLKQSVEQYQA